MTYRPLTPMRRAVVLASVLLIVLGISEQRLVDSSVRLSASDLAPLWQPVVQHRAPFRNCVFIMSPDPRDPYTLTSLDDGVPFDINDDGALDQVSWTRAGSEVAFLALDRDDDGEISSARELIGGHTVAEAHTAPNALMSLAADAAGAEHRAVLDADNPLFLRLVLWTDRNHNGTSEPSELRSARDVLSAIGLGFSGYHRVDPYGNQARYRGYAYVRTGPGPNRVATPDEDRERWRPMYEVCLAARDASVKSTSRSLPPPLPPSPGLRRTSRRGPATSPPAWTPCEAPPYSRSRAGASPRRVLAGSATSNASGAG